MLSVPKLGTMTSAAAILLCVLLGALAVFQLALVAGAPIGRFAWGGQHDVLPTRLRIGSVVSILLYGVFAVIALERARLIDIIQGDTFETVAMWVLTGYFALGIVMNAISRSKSERMVMVPTTIVLTVLSLIVALS
jgi:hypothetical protein